MQYEQYFLLHDIRIYLKILGRFKRKIIQFSVRSPFKTLDKLAPIDSLRVEASRFRGFSILL